MRGGPIAALSALLISALILLPQVISAADSAAANGRALLQALHEADRPLAMALIKKPTDVNSRDETGATPLMWAAQRADAELVGQLLQAGADTNIYAVNGLGPLQVAIANQASDIALLLLAHGAKTNVAREGGGDSFNDCSAHGPIQGHGTADCARRGCQRS